MQPQAVLPIGQTLITCLTLSWEWGLQSRWEMGAGAAPELTVPVQPRTKLVKAWMVTASPPSHPPGRDLPWPAPILHPPPPPRALEFLALPSSEAPMWPALQSTPPHTHTHIQLHQKKTATGIPMAELTEDLETEGLERLEDSWANRK